MRRTLITLTRYPPCGGQKSLEDLDVMCRFGILQSAFRQRHDPLLKTVAWLIFERVKKRPNYSADPLQEDSARCRPSPAEGLYYGHSITRRTTTDAGF